jgi:hypothetical protein
LRSLRRIVLAAGLLAVPACSPRPEPAGEKILWAWERPEDFSFLAPGEARVALLTATVTLQGDELEIYGRRQPLKLPPGVVPIPVVRIESRRPSLSATQGRRLAEFLESRADRRTTPALQIDFDAARSERAFYRELLDALAARLGPEAELSITALASWCLDDRWLARVPVAEAVPMLFDMGREGEAVRGRLDKGEDFREPLCRGSYGLATYQPWPRLKAGRAIYVFADRPWTEAAWRGLPY